MDVSMTTKGPLGTVVASAVACGASGISGGGADCWAIAIEAANAAAATPMAEAKNVFFLRLIPCSRVNHGAAGRKAGTPTILV